MFLMKVEFNLDPSNKGNNNKHSIHFNELSGTEFEALRCILLTFVQSSSKLSNLKEEDLNLDKLISSLTKSGAWK